MNLISVVLPVYNVEKYLELTLHSINNQILNEFELIVVIDGSYDNSEKILNNYNFRDGIKLKIIKQENQGLSAARNIGASSASSLFVTFFDADDYYLPDHLNTMIISKSEITFLSFETTNEANRLGNKKNKEYYPHKLMSANKALILFLNRKIKFHCSSMLIKKNIFDKLNGFNPKFRYGEDFDFLIRLFIFFPNLKIQYIDSKSYKYLIRKNSLMTSSNYMKYSLFYENFMNTLKSIKNYSSSKIIKKIYHRFISSIIRTTAINLDYTGYHKVLISLINNTKNESLFFLLYFISS